MPRIGGKGSPEPLPESPAGLSHEQYDELTRESKVQAGKETLERLKRTQQFVRDRKGRIKNARFLAAVLALRFEKFSLTQIAEVLGCGHDRVKTALERARQDETIDGMLDRLDKIVLPLAVDNVYQGVLAGDKEYTLRVLDGRGIFRSHKSIDAQVKKTVLTMRVSMTTPAHLTGAPLPMVKPGSVVGSPTIETGRPPGDFLEGVVVKQEPAK